MTEPDIDELIAAAKEAEQRIMGILIEEQNVSVSVVNILNDVQSTLRKVLEPKNDEA